MIRTSITKTETQQSGGRLFAKLSQFAISKDPISNAGMSRGNYAESLNFRWFLPN